MSLDALFESIRLNHPIIESARARRAQADTAQQRADGAFDLQINQTTRSRISGFYDGQYLEQEVVQPLQIGGAEISAGYRRSEGTFPVYENFFETLSGGEAAIGLSFSLLRDRDLDNRRAELFEAQFAQTIGRLEELITVNSLLFDGADVYLDWYRVSAEVEVLRGLVELAETRRGDIESRVDSGDFAAIALTEFQTQLLTRQVVLQEAEQLLLTVEQQLLFYWRDEFGQSYSAEDLQLPTAPVAWPFDDWEFNETWRDRIIDNHPTLMDIDAQLEIARNRARLSENNLLPTLDLEMQLGNDFGSGSASLERPESYVALNFNVPLQRNRARADRAAALARVEELEFDRQVQYDRLSLELNQALIQLQAFDQLRQLRQQQADVAVELEIQELARFEAGDSDQFLLNARETTAGQAQLAAIAAEVTWLRQKLALLALGFDLPQF